MIRYENWPSLVQRVWDDVDQTEFGIAMRLYKYVHPDRVDILDNGKIRFTQPAALNDPFEMLPVLGGMVEPEKVSAFLSSDEYREKARTEFVERMREQPLYAEANPDELIAYHDQLWSHLAPIGREFMKLVDDQFVPAIGRGLTDAILSQLGVLCLSETPDNSLMWGHYADSHHGYVIEFDATHPFFDQRKTDRDDLRLIEKVSYSETRPTMTVAGLNSRDMFLTKESKWEYECEWRMVVSLVDAQEHYECSPHDVYLFDLPPGCITGVLIGSRAPEELETRILQILDGTSEYRNVHVKRAVLSDQEYGVTFKHVLRFGSGDLEALLDAYFPPESKVSDDAYVDLTVDLVMMGVPSLDAVEELLSRYSPIVLDPTWQGHADWNVDQAQSDDDRTLTRSATELLHVILSLHFGVAWEDYLLERAAHDAAHYKEKGTVPLDPIQKLANAFPVEEFTRISKELLPKVLGITPEEMERLEREMKPPEDPPLDAG